VVGVEKVFAGPAEVGNGFVGSVASGLRFGADDVVLAVGLVPGGADVDAEFLGGDEGLQLGVGTAGETIADAEGEFRTDFHRNYLVEGAKSGSFRLRFLLVVDGDDGFDGAEFGVGEFGKSFWDFGDVEPVGDPEVGIDVTGFDDLDDFGKIFGEGVAGGKEGLFAAVENGGVGEGQVLGRDADVDDAGGVAAEVETGRHGLVRTRGIDDDVGKVAVGYFFESGEMGAVPLEWEAIFDAEVFGAEIEAALNHVHDDDGDLGHEFEEFEAGEADGTGSDHEDRFAGLWIAALDGVVADGEGFDEGELVVGKVVAGVEFAGGDGPVGLAKSPGAVNANDLDAGAAVGGTFERGAGVGVVEVGLERALIAGFEVGDSIADRDHFESEFVSRSAGVGEEGEFTKVAREVGAADSHTMGADEGFTGSGGFDIRNVDGGDFLNVGEFDGVRHGNGQMND